MSLLSLLSAPSSAIVPPDAPKPIQAPAPGERPITQLDLPKRVVTALEKEGIKFIQQLHPFDDYSTIPGIGASSAEQIEKALQSFEQAPDRIPLTFKGLIIGVGDVQMKPPSGWHLVDSTSQLGPVETEGDLLARLQALTQYNRLMLLVECEYEVIQEFVEYNKIPVVITDRKEC